MVAGSVHSLLHMTFESGAFLKENGFNRSKMGPSPLASISSWSIFHTLHHGMAHALLFSSYEGTKRLLYSAAAAAEEGSLHISSSFQSSGKDNGDMEQTVKDLIVVGLAGGAAGQIQHVASHYTESWLGVGEDQSVKTFWQDASARRRHFSVSKLFRPPGLGLVGPPSIRSTMLAFPPSAIGFIAFEFGKGLMADDADE